MALTTKLELRQSHNLVMTPQLQQAIKLLQLSNMELASFVEAELERNPLLERAESRGDRRRGLRARAEPAAPPPRTIGRRRCARPRPTRAGRGERSADDGEWIDLEAGSGRTEELDAEPQDAFPDADGFSPGALKDSGWASLGQGARASVDEESNLEAYVAEERTLQRPSHRSARARLRRSGAAADRPSPHRHDRRGRIFARRPRRRRRAARRAARAGRGDARGDAGLRALRRVRPRLARMPDASAQGAGPLRPGDGGVDRQPAICSPCTTSPR